MFAQRHEATSALIRPVCLPIGGPGGRPRPGHCIASKIQALKKAANGYRNRDNFKTAIYFHCGGLDLYPDLTH